MKNCKDCIRLVYHGKKNKQIPYCADRHDYLKDLNGCDKHKINPKI
jgi:endogenous inhibitor of DNA gyrase (YacG/DUF329 family)